MQGGHRWRCCSLNTELTDFIAPMYPEIERIEEWSRNIYDERPFITGGVCSKGLRSVKNGRIEVRARYDCGEGFWPAIWLMPDINIRHPYGGEIDIMEHLNYDDIAFQTVHTPHTLFKHEPSIQNYVMGPIDKAQFNTYAVEVNNSEIIFYINGKKTEICIYKTEVPHEFVYNATTKGNYSSVKSKQGNALQTSGEAMNNRVSLWFGTYKFKKGTEFKLVGDLDEYSVGFSISHDGVEFDARKNAALADDSGWIDNTTKSTYTPAGGIKHAYNETTKTYTLMADGYVRVNFKSTEDATIIPEKLFNSKKS